MKMKADGLRVAGKQGTMDLTAATPAPFRFFDLPVELRLRVYELTLVVPTAVDLDPANIRTIAPLLRMFLVSRRVHDEAFRVFYGRNTFRVFPTHGRFFQTKDPLLARLPPQYRTVITKLELRLGPGWTRPPRGWVINDRLGLGSMGKVFWLRIFVDFDPTCHPSFEGFSDRDDFYTVFCVSLLQGLFARVASLSAVEFDADRTVSRSSLLLQSLVNEVKAGNKRITWGSERGWDKSVDVDVADVLQKMSL
ncbi:hypothetical protein BDV95DRAFT_563310 [Massariosphaeria phaeospora]|uniref:F-box domain-containing protein n=1 Tax=Massariosphaeria phaeospora TaxID=100035 RepID=A0A7C8IC95_9PLEO|nr:hypothetical protein BDV95DRAFT_563310 [Massariosphaeria phaeospora]